MGVQILPTRSTINNRQTTEMKGNLNNIKDKGFDKNPQNINRNGRPKKPVLSMKVEGYKLAEINDTIQMMVGMTLAELAKVWENPKSTILEKTIASALRKSIEKGNLESVETLLNRVYGKPKEKVEQDINITNHAIKLKFGNEKGDEQQQ